MNKKKHQQPRTSSHPQQPIRENRDRSQGGSRPSSVAKDVPIPENSAANPTEEAFKNKRLVHSCTSLIGSKVLIELSNGDAYEGVFRLISPQFEIIIEVAHLIDPKEPLSEDKIHQTIVFPFKNIVRCSAIDTDLNYAKEVFLTDSQISNSKNNGDLVLKQLEEWQPDADDNIDYNKMSLGNGHGWAPEDMFAHNASKHGYKSSFNANLEGYTVQLKVEDTDDYRKREAFAAEKAREIESGSDINRTNVELDDGDEESAFSAVHRPGKNESSEPDSKRYVPPAKRNSSNSHVRDQRNHGPRPQGSSSQYQSGGQSQQHGARDFHQRSKVEKDYQSGSQQAPSPHSVRDLHTQSQHHHDEHGRSVGGGSQLRRSSAQGRELSRDDHEQHQGTRQVSGRGGANNQGSRSREQLSDLKEFGNKFQLTSSQPIASPEHSSPKSQQQPYIPQQAYNMTTQAQIPPSQAQISLDNSESRDVGILQRADEQQHEIHNLHPHEGGQETPVDHTPPPATPTATTPVIKSTLNPNAKEFTLNPNAKAFVPGAVQAMVAMSPSGTPSISATPPQRPITPGTPLSYPPAMMQGHQQFIQGGPVHPPIVQYLPSASIFNPGQPQIAYGIPQSPTSGQIQQPQAMLSGDMGPPNQMMGQLMHPGNSMVGGSPSQGPSFMQQYPPQQQFNPSLAMIPTNQNMMMRLPHGTLNPMMFAQSAGGSGVPVAGMVDMSGHQQHPMVTWMSQTGQGPIPQMPPPGNTNHLVQPPPPSVASQIQNQLPGQQPSQQVGSNGGGHTPAPSPGPMSMYNPAVPQSIPHQFTGSFSPNVFVVSHGTGHQPHMMPGQGQIPPMHGYPMAQHPHSLPGQQNAPHMMTIQQQGPVVPPPLAPQ